MKGSEFIFSKLCTCKDKRLDSHLNKTFKEIARFCSKCGNTLTYEPCGACDASGRGKCLICQGEIIGGCQVCGGTGFAALPHNCVRVAVSSPMGTVPGVCTRCKGTGKISFPTGTEIACIECKGRGWLS